MLASIPQCSSPDDDSMESRPITIEEAEELVDRNTLDRILDLRRHYQSEDGPFWPNCEFVDLLGVVALEDGRVGPA